MPHVSLQNDFQKFMSDLVKKFQGEVKSTEIKPYWLLTTLTPVELFLWFITDDIYSLRILNSSAKKQYTCNTVKQWNNVNDLVCFPSLTK